jgi:hypothetical protein
VVLAKHRLGFVGLSSSGRAACFLIAAHLGSHHTRVTHTPGGLVTCESDKPIDQVDLAWCVGCIEACNALCGSSEFPNDFYLKMHERPHE